MPRVHPSPAPACPAPPPRVATKPTQALAHGRVNHVTAEEAIATLDIILGTLLVNSHPAAVLFDLRASHSFIKEGFTTHHQFEFHTLQPLYLIQSLGLILRTDQICPDVKVEIQGVEFLVNLIVINLEGMDVILGMDLAVQKLGAN